MNLKDYVSSKLLLAKSQDLLKQLKDSYSSYYMEQMTNLLQDDIIPIQDVIKNNSSLNNGETLRVNKEDFIIYNHELYLPFSIKKSLSLTDAQKNKYIKKERYVKFKSYTKTELVNRIPKEELTDALKKAHMPKTVFSKLPLKEMTQFLYKNGINTLNDFYYIYKDVIGQKTITLNRFNAQEKDTLMQSNSHFKEFLEATRTDASIEKWEKLNKIVKKLKRETSFYSDCWQKDMEIDTTLMKVSQKHTIDLRDKYLNNLLSIEDKVKFLKPSLDMSALKRAIYMEKIDEIEEKYSFQFSAPQENLADYMKELSLREMYNKKNVSIAYRAGEAIKL